MSETKREPAFWVVKFSNGMYSGPSYMASIRRLCDRFDSAASAREYASCAGLGAKVVAVYVTTRKLKRGRSWAWACKRMLEGKRVTRAGWSSESWIEMLNAYPRDSDGRFHQSGEVDMRATDWELAE